MEVINRLNEEFLSQASSAAHHDGATLDLCRLIARNYAQMECAIAVLSDWRAGVSYIYYGACARLLGLKPQQAEEKVNSVWEDEIFSLIHPGDLAAKHLNELRFLHFIKHQPRKCRSHYHLAEKLRMKSPQGNYIGVLHRIFYLPAAQHVAPWLALCIYSPSTVPMTAKCLIVNAANGCVTEIEEQDNSRMLSRREKQVLQLIDKGMTSKQIAATLSISVNTVSRHRQEILAKLKAKNSIEACTTAKDLKLI